MYNSAVQNTFYKKHSGKDQMMNSLDNILAPFESKTFYENPSPFASTRTLNKIGKSKISLNSSTDREITIKNKLFKNKSEAQQQVKDFSGENTESELYFPDNTVISGN